MKVLYAKALVKDLEAVARNPGVKKRLLKLIEELKKINALEELHNIKKIERFRLRSLFQRTPAPDSAGVARWQAAACHISGNT